MVWRGVTQVWHTHTQGDSEHAFEEVFAAAYVAVDRAWLDTKASYMQFPQVLRYGGKGWLIAGGGCCRVLLHSTATRIQANHRGCGACIGQQAHNSARDEGNACGVVRSTVQHGGCFGFLSF